MSPQPPVAWWVLLQAVRHPGPPPPGLLGMAFLLLVLCVATVVVMIWLGQAWHAEPHHFFRERKAGTYLSFVNLLATAVVSALIARRLRPAPVARFWWLMAALFVWVAADDLFTIHEEIDRTVHALLGLDPDHDVTDHFDDLIVAGYGVVAVALAHAYREHLASFPWMLVILAAASLLFVAMIVLDFLHDWPTAEDASKVIAETVIFVGFLAAWLQTTPTGGGR